MSSRFLLQILFSTLLACCAHADGGMHPGEPEDGGHEAPTETIPAEEIAQKLKTEGLQVWIHGSVGQHGMYVVSYRRPDNFFVFVDISVYPTTAETRELLKASKRHDMVRLWGRMENEKTKQPHVAVTKMVVEKKYEGLDQYPPYERKQEIPKDLNGKTEFIGKVHALFMGGEVMVMEYGDAVVPVFVEEALRPLTAKLNRGDKIKVQFVVQESPKRPPHLNLNKNAPKPLEVLWSPATEHNKQMTKEGALVMFPQSPQIVFNVFAVKVDVGNGIFLEYTLVNFDNPELFKKLREKCQLAWDAHKASLKNDRNKLLNPRLYVKATGNINYIDANQANPQVLIDSVDKLVIEVR